MAAWSVLFDGADHEGAGTFSVVPNGPRSGQGMLRMFYDNKSKFNVRLLILSWCGFSANLGAVHL
jgi:hypothetical protein